MFCRPGTGAGCCAGMNAMADINGLSNFMDVMVAASKVLFVYLRRGGFDPASGHRPHEDYLNIFTGNLRCPRGGDDRISGPDIFKITRRISRGN